MVEVPIPLHLAVHILGVAVAAGVVVVGATLGRRTGPTWPGYVLGGLLVAASHVLTGALLVTDGTLPLVLRAAGYAGLAVAAAGPLTGATAVTLVAPLGVHLMAALAGMAAATAALRGRARLLGPVRWLVVGLVAWAVADVLGRSTAAPAAYVSLAGSGAVAVWVVARARATLLARALVAGTALVLTTALVLSAGGGAVVAQDLADDQARALQALAGAQANVLVQDGPDELATLAEALAGETLAAQLTAGRALDDRAASLVRQLPAVDVAVLLDADRRVVGSHSGVADVPGPLPPADEATLAGDDLVALALGTATSAGVTTLADGQVLAIGASPIAPRGEDGGRRLDRAVGVLLLGTSLTSTAAVGEVADATASAAAVVLGGRVVARGGDLPDVPGLDEALVAAAADGLPVTVQVGDVDLDVASDQLGPGRLVLLRDAAVGDDVREDTTRALFLAALLGLLAAGLLGLLGARVVVEPIRRLTEAVEQVAAGDRTEPLGLRGRDEVGRLAVAFDGMTSAVRAREDALAEAATTEADLRQRLEVVTESLSEALVVVDQHGSVTRANPAAEALLGGSGLVGRPVTRVLVGVDDQGRSLLRALIGSVGDAVRGRVGPRDVPVVATSAPLRDADGGSLGRVHLLRDVTGEEQVERMKTEFLSNVSHELRTPLTPVLGYGELLRTREVPTDKVRAIGSEISRSARRALRVIDMLVDFAAIEAGRAELTPETLDVRDVVAELLAGDVPWDGSREVRVEVADDAPGVFADRKQLVRLLLELVDNAVKYTDGPVDVLVRRDGEGAARIAVRDRGDGVPQDVVDSLGEGFRQGDGSATRQVGGLGLGLALAVRIADALGGAIAITDAAGGGAEVVVTLPAGPTS